MTFSTHSALKIWCIFFGLIICAAIHISQIEDLMYYMDDAWSYDTNPILTYYVPYDCFYPAKQVTLLHLYNDLGLPHIKSKQLFSPTLEIIGLYIDPQVMTISISEESCDRLIAAIHAFIDTSKSRKRLLIEWQCILSWINWGLNMFPLLCPALQSLYMKIARKHVTWGMIYLNKAVIHHFTWLTDTIEASNGIHLLDVIKWAESDADLIIYCDTLLSGLGFIAQLLRLGFYAVIPEN